MEMQKKGEEVLKYMEETGRRGMGVAQGHHEQNAQNAAAQGDQGDLQDAGLVAQVLFCPQEQCGRGEDGTGGHALACGTDGLQHVALQNGVLLMPKL